MNVGGRLAGTSMAPLDPAGHWIVSDGLAHEQSVCLDQLVLPGTGEGHDEFDPSDTDPGKGADFQQFQPDRRGGQPPTRVRPS